MTDTTDLNIGDLVETCEMYPGFVTSINGTSVTVFVPTKLNSYCSIYGGNHSIHNCGVRKISTEYAMMLFSFPEEELNKMYEEKGDEIWENVIRKAYNEKLKKGQRL